jgi:polysaccharide pyruvyl transferase WcaK-like protein
MIGAGVEDPSFEGINSFSGAGELAKWGELLRDFDEVCVRGPRSASLLAEIGVEAKVVGDPALLLAPPRPPERIEALVVSLGYGDDLRGGQQLAVVEAVVGAVASYADQGVPVRFVAISPRDVEWAEASVARIPRAEVVVVNRPIEWFAAVADARLVIAERLHAAVLAAAAGVPVVALAYQPKVDDFMASIGQEAQCLPTDGLLSGQLRDLVETAWDAHDMLRGDLHIRVDALRQLLCARADRIRRILGLPPGAALVTAGHRAGR